MVKKRKKAKRNITPDLQDEPGCSVTYEIIFRRVGGKLRRYKKKVIR